MSGFSAPVSQNDPLAPDPLGPPPAAQADRREAILRSLVRQDVPLPVRLPGSQEPVGEAEQMAAAMRKAQATQRQQTDQLMMASLAEAVKVDPTTRAEAVTIANGMGISDVGYVERNLPVLREVARRRAIAAMDLAGTNPRLAEHLTDLDFARLAHDDIQELSTWELTMRRWDAARTQVELAGLADKMRWGTATPEEIQKIAELRAKLQSLPQDSGWNPVAGTAYVVGQLYSTLPTALAMGVTTGAAYAGMAALAGQAGPQAALPEEVVTVPTGFGAGFWRGFTGTLFLQSANIEGGLAYLEMLDKGYSKEAAKWASTGVGLVNGALEVTGEALLARPLLQNLKRDVARGLLQRTTTQALKEAGKHYLVGSGGELATEITQELSQAVGEEIARQFSPNKENLPSDWKSGQIIPRLLEVAKETAVGTSLIGGFAPTVRFMHDVRTANQAIAAHDFVKALQEGAAASKVAERSPEAWMRYVASTAKGNVEDLFVDGQQFATVLQQLDVTTEGRMSKDLEVSAPDVYQQIADAAAHGNDVVIPTEVFAGKIARSELGAALVDHIRTDPDGISYAAAKEVIGKREKYFAEQAAKVEQELGAASEWVQQADKVEEAMAEKMRSAAVPATQIAPQAAFYRNFVTTMARQMNMTPEQFDREHGLRAVIRGVPPGTGEHFNQNAPKSLEDVRADWSQKGIENYVSEKNGVITLSQIVVPKEQRGHGIGSDAMRKLVAYADSTRQRIALSPSVDFGASSKSRLVRFYKQFGFFENKGRNKDFTISETMIREPVKLPLFQTVGTMPGSPEFDAWFKQSKVVDANGKPQVVYHGTARPDRVGNRFRKSRATSGPMAFFTDSPELASNYSQTKADTSRVDEGVDYGDWFKIKVGRREVPLSRLWWNLSSEQRAKIAARAGHVSNDANGDLVYDESTNKGLGGYDQHLKEARGNHILALTEEWLNSAALFDNEQEFVKVLDLAGLDLPVREDFPHQSNPGVFPVYLSIQNPLDTANIPPEVAAQLEKVGKRKRGPKLRREVDLWDKGGLTGPQWLARLADDRANGTTHAWTSIPDWVTETLQSLGYDGIKDVSGKGGGEQHAVWIPFEETQVKSIWNRGTWSQTDPNILHAEGDAREVLGGYQLGGGTAWLHKKANLSTFLHEMGHYYLDVLSRLGTQPTAAPAVRMDFQRVLIWFGIKDEAAWRALSPEEQRPYHEMWARNFEAYLATGKAPSYALDGAFARFRAWLVRTYKDVIGKLNQAYRDEFHKDLPALTPEVRAVMDRLFASEEQIREYDSIYNPAVFQTKEEFTAGGRSEAQWNQYQLALEEYQQKAIADMTAQSLGTARWLSVAAKRAAKDFDRERAAAEKEIATKVRAELEASPLYRAERALRFGEAMNDAGEMVPLKLDREAVLQILGGDEKALARFGRGKSGMLTKGGASPDIVAAMFGYPSGERLVQELAAALTLEEAVKANTAAQLFADAPEWSDPEFRQFQIEKAIHNELRGKFLHREDAGHHPIGIGIGVGEQHR